MKVKICGLMDEMTAIHAVEQGATALGFVFADSKRRISIEKAKNIISNLPEDIEKVGVFVNPTQEMVEEVVSKTAITIVQLHGDETPEFCQSLSFPTIKAFSIDSKLDLLNIHKYPSEYILLDGPKGKYVGGNGIAFDWSILSDVNFLEKKLILAGGLNAHNVLKAIETIKPYMVDVSSGVETNGKKDFNKIECFLKLVKNV